MSYILDALRKADAQRERDASRGIHAQPSAPASGTRPTPRWIAWGAAIAGIAAIVVAGLYFTRSPLPAATPVVTAPAAAPAPMPPVAMQPAAPVKMLAPQEVAKSISPPPPVAATVQPATRGMPPNSSGPAPSSDDRARMAREAAFGRAPAGPAPAPAATPAPQVAQPAVPAEAPSATGLPPDAPRVAISGGVYSTSAAQRMLIVNGQVFNEGSEVAPGLVIEKIDPRTAILRFRGSRYSVAY